MSRWFSVVRLRLRSLLLRERVEDELDEELRYHLERQQAEYEARGLTREAARLAAQRAFGGVEQRKEEARDARGVRLLEEIVHDLRYAVRMLRRSPAFTAVAVLSLALAIGANAAVFGAIDALLLRRLPVREPERLVTFEQVLQDGHRHYNFSLSDFEQLRALAPVVSGLAAITWPDRYNVVVGSGAGVLDEGRVRLSVVTGSYFDVLGRGALIGRTLTPDDDRAPGAHAVAVISHAYWERSFGGAGDVLGRGLSISGMPFTVVGVMPRPFAGDWVGRPTDVWVSASMIYQVAPERPPGLPGAGFQYKVLGRLRPGVSLAEAQAAGEAVYRQLVERPPANSGLSQDARFHVLSAATGYSPQRETFTEPLLILAAMVGAVLLVACSNVANLLLARAAARRSEIAVRLAIGAGRGRIARQLVTESLLLALVAGALGVAFSYWGSQVLSGFVGAGPVTGVGAGAMSLSLELRPDPRVLGFTLLLALATGVLFGLVPALQASRVDIGAGFGARGGSASGSTTRLRRLLVVSQVALSLVLLTGSGLFVRSLGNLRTEALGFDTERLLLVWTLPGQTARQEGELASLFEAAEQRIAALPGVAGASATREGLLSGDPSGTPPIRVAERPAIERRADWQMTVGPGFFATIGQRLLQGRDFAVTDRAATPRVIVVSESLARRFFPAESALGRSVTIGAGQNPPAYEIVGVVSDAKQNSPRAERGMTIYYPYRQQPPGRLGRMGLVVRTAADPALLATRIRATLRALDPRLPVLKIDTLAEQLDDVLFQDRLVASLAVFFGAAAVLLACLGLYGVLSYAVARRTNEIGIRLALGAGPGQVSRMILGESLQLVLLGTAVGLPAALLSARLVANRLFGVDAADAATLAAAVSLLAAVAAVAGFLPARRAARVDPVRALRSE